MVHSYLFTSGVVEQLVVRSHVEDLHAGVDWSENNLLEKRI